MSGFFRCRVILIFSLLAAVSCTEENALNDPSFEEARVMPPVEGSRIAWDYSTLTRVSSPASNTKYNGYARLIQLPDHSLLCVYEADGNILVTKSPDRGASWLEPVMVAVKQDGINMAVPDIMELNDGSILVCYNPRPFNIHPSRKFGIRSKKSYDGGNTWEDERLLYEAGHEFENGCWEPSAVQLPDGEIQLFFADEGPYTHSSEQNISLLRSHDNGLSWTTTPEIISFRAGSRDGMPVPILLKNKREIAISIEDNGFQNFKPYIIKSLADFKWPQQPADGNSQRRSHALYDKIDDQIYAGAPYLVHLKSGETVLSYQGTEERENKIGFAEMKVVIGDENARNFSRKTVPFDIPANKSGLWNSIAVLDDNSVIAFTSTSAYSATGNTEVWMIRGHVVEPLQAKRQSIVESGKSFNEDLWGADFPVFVGHKSLTQAYSQMVYDDDYLYVRSKISDRDIIKGLPEIEDNDGISVYLDPKGLSLDKPDAGIFSIFLSASNQLVVKEGQKGTYQPIESHQVLHRSTLSDEGYVLELGIPWQLVGGKPDTSKRMGFNISLHESAGKINAGYIENISSAHEMKPYTWMALELM